MFLCEIPPQLNYVTVVDAAEASCLSQYTALHLHKISPLFCVLTNIKDNLQVLLH